MEFDLKNLRSDGKGMVIDSVQFSDCGIKWIHTENKLRITPDMSSDSRFQWHPESSCITVYLLTDL